MSKTNTSTEIYITYKRLHTVERDDAAVAAALRQYKAKCVNSGTFLPTKQRDHTYVVPGIFDQLMCLQLGSELSQVLGLPVVVTTRYEDTDLGKLLSGAAPLEWVPAQDPSAEEREAAGPDLRQQLLDTLAAAGVAKSELRYDGYGDEGQIEEIEAWNAAGESVDLAKVSVHGTPSPLPGERTLHNLFEDWFYDAMFEKFAGWEINEGSRGEIAVDVGAGTMTCDHSWRITNDTSVSL